MRFVPQKVEFLHNNNYKAMLDKLEMVARNCYQSEPNNNQEEFLKRLISMGHDSILEHVSFTMRITTDRATANQIVRHRTGKYSQESQRYCNYTKDKFENQITFIEPIIKSDEVIMALEYCEKMYFDLIENGYSPEQARQVLPNQTKTSLIMTMDLRNLRNFLKLRMSKHAQEPIRRIANDIYSNLLDNYPIFVSGIEIE